MKTKQPRKVVDAAARLAVFAMKRHEELHGASDEVGRYPIEIQDMALALGLSVLDLIARGWDLNRGSK